MKPAPAPASGRFVTGSIMGHVVNMTLTGAVGLMAMFMVDLVDLYYLGLLNQTEVTAAIGFAGLIAFTNLSMSIGTGIAAAALVARNIGARQPEQARQFASSTLLFTLILSSGLTLVIAALTDPVLQLLGAKGEALELAKLFLWTLSPGYVLLAGAVCCSFILRGLGDPRRAMYITLASAVVTAVLDPLFIFQFGWGIQGAAMANVVAYATALGIALNGTVRVHRFLVPLSLAGLRRDFSAIAAIALPAVLTQMATPFATAYITWATAPFGDEAVAASAITGRIVPVAFGIIFALSGSVGPIIGQNFGASNLARVRETLRAGLAFAAVYTLLTSFLLFVFRHDIAEAFRASGRTIDLVVFFCTYIAVSWAFAGAQFVANAAFNNLGRPNLSTWFNWGKSTLGTIPLAGFLAMYWGPEGVLAGTAIGAVIFGIASVFAAYRIVDRLEITGAE